MNFNRIACLAIAGLAAIGSFDAAAQAWPSRPVRVVVPAPPGGGLDFVARVVGDKLAERWAQPVVVDNRAGASMVIGSEAVARAAPDGYTLLVMPLDVMLNPSVVNNPKFDPLKDLTPISTLATSVQILAVNPATGIRSIADLIARAKTEPGKIAYSSCGNGSPGQLVGEMLKAHAGIEITHVPYKGCAPAVADAVGGQVALTIGGTGTVAQYLKSGRLVAIATAGTARDPQQPGTPTVSESGFQDVTITNWFGLFAPAGTPTAVLDKVYADLSRIYAEGTLPRQIADRTLSPMLVTPAAFAQMITTDVTKFRAMMQKIGVKAD